MAIARKHLHTTTSSFNPHQPSRPDALDLAMLTLNDGGVIQHCSSHCEQVFGYRTDELAGHHVSTLLPELQGTELVMDDRINARLAFLCHCAIPFQARRRDGRCFSSELFINRLNQQNVVVLVRNLEARP